MGRLMRKIDTEERQYRFIGSSLEMQKLYYRDIVYICKEKSSKYVRYITLHGDYRERITLEQVAEELTDAIYCDRAWISCKHATYYRYERGEDIS